MADSSKSQYHVPNLERALVIIEHMATLSSGITMADLAKVLDYPRNSVFRIISTLETTGYVKRDPADNKFILTNKLLSLGYSAVGETSLLENALDLMHKLRDASGETTLIGLLLDGEGVVLDQVLTKNPVKFMVNPGTRFPLHTSAPGKAFLAFLPDELQKEQLKKMTLTKYNAKTITDKKALLKELETVRKEGFALDLGEQIDGLHCIGAPIFDYTGIPKASVWVTGPASRLTKDLFAKTGQLVKEHARMISERLGFQPDQDA